MFYGMQLYPNRLFWDLFCSKECCQSIHGDEPCEFFHSAEAFKEQTGISPRSRHQPPKCFCCGEELTIA